MYCFQKLLLQIVAESPAYSVVAGGESVAATKLFGVEEKINYLSTGGGAALAYVSGEALPGLDNLYS